MKMPRAASPSRQRRGRRTRRSWDDTFLRLVFDDHRFAAHSLARIAVYLAVSVAPN